ncbi:MAG: hypothetical protein H7334_07210 [Ferruginibacter sp.]|nr:hypothetical protein [Ferruginibacter sp.]
MPQKVFARLLLIGFKKGSKQIAIIATAKMQVNFISKRSPIKNAEPDKGLPKGLYLKKNNNRYNVITNKKLTNTEIIQRSSRGIRFKNIMIIN